jgi:hypothetical protein
MCKQSPLIMRASEDGPIGPKHVLTEVCNKACYIPRLFYSLIINIIFILYQYF